MSFKKIFRIRTGALIAVAFAGISASAGGMDSGGGDLRAPDSGAAWFLGTRPVRYCLRLSPDFGLEQERVQEELNEALSQWREYLLERMIPEWASDLPLHLNLERMDRCTGSEDLRFDFGWRDPEVDAAMKDYESPVAFAHRAQYDPKAGWGKGFLWFAPIAP